MYLCYKYYYIFAHIFTVFLNDIPFDFKYKVSYNFIQPGTSQTDIRNPLRYLLITSLPLCGSLAGAQSPAGLSKPW